MTWKVTGPDERHLRDALSRLDEHKADPERRSAVLILREDDGIVGAWTRAGAAALAPMLLVDPPSDAWVDIRNALLTAVTGP